MEVLSGLTLLWYFLIFPVAAFIVREDREVPILYAVLIFSNHYLFDVVGVLDTHWFLFQALYDLMFVLVSCLLSNKYLRLACIIVCLNMFAINLTEHLSTYATVMYNWWEIINWIVIDLIALCVVTNDKLSRSYVPKH